MVLTNAYAAASEICDLSKIINSNEDGDCETTLAI